MRVLFHLGHPAHFHLFKHVITRLKKDGVEIEILIKEKDVLSSLLNHARLDYHNILPEGRSSSKTGLIQDLIKRGSRIISLCRATKPDLLIGTSADISYVGKLLNIPAINVIEDDNSHIPLYGWLAYPWATEIISPDCCDNGRWNKKTRVYPGYHELAYLHPDIFTPEQSVVGKYFYLDEPYFILRLVQHTAYHDNRLMGIDDQLGIELIRILSRFGRVILNSERNLPPELESYRLSINPSDIHHLLAFAKIVLGDGHTVPAEAGVLGTPYIRINDFTGKVGYLRELEEIYELGYGFRTEQKDLIIKKAVELASASNTDEIFQKRRKVMLANKINVTEYLYEYISKNVIHK